MGILKKLLTGLIIFVILSITGLLTLAFWLTIIYFLIEFIYYGYTMYYELHDDGKR